MPRRPAPSPLRLHQGPLPARGQPKHTLPSLPRPAFHPPVQAAPGPAPRSRAQSLAEHDEPPMHSTARERLPGVAAQPRSSFGSTRTSTDSGASSPVSAAASREGDAPPAAGTASAPVVRGPWDHSASIKVVLDISDVLPPPAPAALV